MRKSIYNGWLETDYPNSSEDMPRLTDEHRIFIVEEMVKSGSPTATRRKLETKFGVAMSKLALKRVFKK